ncbi:MAG: hypothetical protein RL701_1774, partial [Pseudomonadota bacterium]
MKRIMLVSALLASSAASCEPAHIAAFKPRLRDYKVGAYEKAPTSVSGGSLWQESSRSLVADFRASRVGDLVMVRIDESPEAKGDADTKMDRDSSMGFGAP